jgi:hypothetical protein
VVVIRNRDMHILMAQIGGSVTCGPSNVCVPTVVHGLGEYDVSNGGDDVVTHASYMSSSRPMFNPMRRSRTKFNRAPACYI